VTVDPRFGIAALLLAGALVVTAACGQSLAPGASPDPSPVSTPTPSGAGPSGAGAVPVEATLTGDTTTSSRKPFRFTKQRIDPPLAQRMSSSWRPGCPVGLKKLRYLRIRHWRFDGTTRMGEMVVHRDAVPAVKYIFLHAYRAGFRIKRMRLVDVYGGDDDRSMEANNTSAFNCRTVAGTSTWSEHAYGRAIDVNPVQNPYVRGSTVEPAKGGEHVDRSVPARGKILEGEPFVRAVDAAAWGWGGRWRYSKDYQHISATGR
jgi:hypothetical protein